MISRLLKFLLSLLPRGGGMAPVLEQEYWRIRDDLLDPDGGTPNWVTTENQASNFVVVRDTTFRVRFVMANTGDANTATSHALYYRLNGTGSWIAVTTSTPIQADPAANGSYNTRTIQTANFRLTAGTGSAVDGEYIDSSAVVGIRLSGGDYSEFEFGLSIDSTQVSSGDTFELRVYQGDGTPVDVVDSEPTIEVSSTITASGTIDVSAALHAYQFGFVRLTCFNANTSSIGVTVGGTTAPWRVGDCNDGPIAGYYPKAGNLLVIVAACDTDLRTPVPDGDGWTQAVINQDSTLAATHVMHYKICDGTDTSVYVGWTTATSPNVALIQEIVGPFDSSPLDQVATNSVTTLGQSHPSGTTAAQSASDNFAIASFCCVNTLAPLTIDAGDLTNSYRPLNRYRWLSTYLGINTAGAYLSDSSATSTTLSTTSYDNVTANLIATFKRSTGTAPTTAAGTATFSATATADGKNLAASTSGEDGGVNLEFQISAVGENTTKLSSAVINATGEDSFPPTDWFIFPRPNPKLMAFGTATASGDVAAIGQQLVGVTTATGTCTTSGSCSAVGANLAAGTANLSGDVVSTATALIFAAGTINVSASNVSHGTSLASGTATVLGDNGSLSTNLGAATIDFIATLIAGGGTQFASATVNVAGDVASIGTLVGGTSLAAGTSTVSASTTANGRLLASATSTSSATTAAIGRTLAAGTATESVTVAALGTGLVFAAATSTFSSTLSTVGRNLARGTATVLGDNGSLATVLASATSSSSVTVAATSANLTSGTATFSAVVDSIGTNLADTTKLAFGTSTSSVTVAATATGFVFAAGTSTFASTLSTVGRNLARGTATVLGDNGSLATVLAAATSTFSANLAAGGGTHFVSGTSTEAVSVAAIGIDTTANDVYAAGTSTFSATTAASGTHLAGGTSAVSGQVVAVINGAFAFATVNVSADLKGNSIQGVEGRDSYYLEYQPGANAVFGFGSVQSKTYEFLYRNPRFGGGHNSIIFKQEATSLIDRVEIYVTLSGGQYQLNATIEDGNGVPFSVGATTDFPDDEIWHHCAFVVDRSADLLRCYIDGEAAGTTDISAMISVTPNTGTPYLLGAPSEQSFRYGAISEFRVWNTARTQQNIQDNIYTKLVGNELNLVCLLPCDGYTGEPVTDQGSSIVHDLHASSTDFTDQVAGGLITDNQRPQFVGPLYNPLRPTARIWNYQFGGSVLVASGINIVSASGTINVGAPVGGSGAFITLRAVSTPFQSPTDGLSGHTISAPATRQVGDLLIVQLVGLWACNLHAQAGWTAVHAAQDTHAAYWRFATGDANDDFDIASSGNFTYTAQMAAFELPAGSYDTVSQVQGGTVYANDTSQNSGWATGGIGSYDNFDRLLTISNYFKSINSDINASGLSDGHVGLLTGVDEFSTIDLHWFDGQNADPNGNRSNWMGWSYWVDNASPAEGLTAGDGEHTETPNAASGENISGYTYRMRVSGSDTTLPPAASDGDVIAVGTNLASGTITAIGLSAGAPGVQFASATVTVSPQLGAVGSSDLTGIGTINVAAQLVASGTILVPASGTISTLLRVDAYPYKHCGLPASGTISLSATLSAVEEPSDDIIVAKGSIIPFGWLRRISEGVVIEESTPTTLCDFTDDTWLIVPDDTFQFDNTVYATGDKWLYNPDTGGRTLILDMAGTGWAMEMVVPLTNGSSTFFREGDRWKILQYSRPVLSARLTQFAAGGNRTARAAIVMAGNMAAGLRKKTCLTPTATVSITGATMSAGFTDPNRLHVLGTISFAPTLGVSSIYARGVAVGMSASMTATGRLLPTGTAAVEAQAARMPMYGLIGPGTIDGRRLAIIRDPFGSLQIYNNGRGGFYTIGGTGVLKEAFAQMIFIPTLAARGSRDQIKYRTGTITVSGDFDTTSPITSVVTGITMIASGNLSAGPGVTFATATVNASATATATADIVETLSLTGGDIHSVVSNGDSYSGIQVRQDGRVFRTSFASSTLTFIEDNFRPNDWIEPESQAPGSYKVRATRQLGAVPNGSSVGVWIDLSVQQPSWWVFATAVAPETSSDFTELLIEISIDEVTILESGVYSILASSGFGL